LGLQDRGLLKVGYAADIVMFDPNTIADKGTFVEPNQYPEGIEIVMVNGRIALINGTKVMPVAVRLLENNINK
jgi:N-acyl-D-amino-acid deacylase